MLGEFPRALVCTGEGQALGLRTTDYCSPHAVASSWGCIHTDVTSHGLGCHWDVLGGSSGRAGPWYYGLNKREGIHSLPGAW